MKSKSDNVDPMVRDISDKSVTGRVNCVVVFENNVLSYHKFSSMDYGDQVKNQSNDKKGPLLCRTL